MWVVEYSKKGLPLLAVVAVAVVDDDEIGEHSFLKQEDSLESKDRDKSSEWSVSVAFVKSDWHEIQVRIVQQMYERKERLEMRGTGVE